MTPRTRASISALLCAFAVFVAACGDGGETASVSGDPGASSETSGDTSGDESSTDAFPVTIEHRFGETTIEAEPERVVSIGFNEHDFLLAIGVTPVGLRDWFGDQPNAVWPWAQDELGDATPEVLPSTELNFEQIAALDPDLIVGVWSGIDSEDYELLSAIAPTVAQPDTYEDYGTPWQEQTMILGRATGRVDRAEEVVATIEGRFAEVRDAHPEWDGLSAGVAFVTEDGPGVYATQDTRSRVMEDLGFDVPDRFDEGTNSFYLELSAEDLSPMDTDVLVWVVSTEEEVQGILDRLPTRRTLDVVEEGREVFAGLQLTGAFSHASPLSLEFVLDELVPELEAAADGDPSTPVPSAVDAGAA